ncbi:MAG: DnaJ C-terminal domain-containing protein [Pseudomonadota bacterium]
MSKDPYSELGVARSASADEIRRAYKRKAKETHPDLHPGDAAKAEKFKAASAAYELLGDAQKRAQYDRGDIDADGNPKGFTSSARSGAHGFSGFSRSASGSQSDPFDDILSGMFGGGRRRPGPSKGSDMRYRVEIAFEDSVRGAKREMKMADGRALNISIPAGVETGQSLRLKSQGKSSSSGGPPGDAILELVVRPHPVWTRDGDDIRMTVPVPLHLAVLGGQIDVTTPMGPIALKVPEGSNSGAVLRLRGKGVQIPGKPGHLYARLEIVVDNMKDPGLKEWAKRQRG